MTATDTASDSGTTPADGPRRRFGVVRSALRRGVPFALELVALTAFVFARPVFGSFGRSPETFIARGADWTDVVAFGLVVLLVPPLVLLAVELVVGLVAGERARRVVHLVLVAGLLAMVAWQLAESFLDADARLVLAVSLVVGVGLALLWHRFASVGLFFRYAALGAVVFLVQFLVLSPTSSIVLGGRHTDTSAGPTGLGADAAPVVVVVLDGLSTGTLLDGTGDIDGELYPNLASLAGDATWYRNHTTVAQVTLGAVPALLSGTQPASDEAPAVASNYPNNIFTLLSESHDVHSAEAITGLCPVRVCPEPAGSPVGGLLHDAGAMWRLQMADTAVDPELIPAAFDERYEGTEEWIAAQDFAPGDRPDLHVLHMLVPHPLWEYLPDGSDYSVMSNQPQGFVGSWSEWGIPVGRQRQVLQTQAADRLVGDLLDRLRADDAYDDSLVVVTADHGYAFTEGASWRGLHEDNYDEIMWTPLIVKSPGQTEAVIDDSNVNSLDVLPTVAAELGIDELPWQADGRPAGSVERDAEDKWIVDWTYGDLRAEDGSDLVHVDGVEGFERVLASDPVEATGPGAVWRRTEYGALVGRDVSELDIGDPAGEVLEVNGMERWDHVDMDRPPLELTGLGPLPPDAVVAVSVDGVVAAVVPATQTSYGVGIVHALLWPEALGQGRNVVAAHLVEGDVSAPELHELTIVPRA